MSMQSQRTQPEISPAEHRPIELITENGFSILRSWEIDHVAPPVDGKFRFVVRGDANSERTIIVAVTAEVVAWITLRTCGRIRLPNSFWIYASERHLANYLGEQNDYPPGDQLLIEELDSEDCLLALRWETT